MDEQERVLLSRLSVFSGGWILDAAQVVSGFDQLDEFDVFDLLEQLINKSLVTVQHPPEGEARYGMLESIRQYAQNKLFEAEEGETLRDRHTDYYVAMVELYDRQALGPEFYTWLNRFALEGDNLRAVYEWIAEDRPRLTLRFTGMLLQYEVGWIHYREARSWLEPVVARASVIIEEGGADIEMTDLIRAMRSLGWLMVTHGDMVSGHPVLDESIRLAGKYEETRLLAVSLGMKAQAMGSTVSREIIQELEGVIGLCRREAYEAELVMALFSLGQAFAFIGETDKGREKITEVMQLVERYDVLVIKAWAYFMQATLARLTGHFSEAEYNFSVAIEANEKLGNRRLAATGRSELAHLYRREGRLEEAAAIYRQTILSWQEQGHQAAVAHQLECFAYLAILRERFADAAQLLGAAHIARERTNSPSSEQQEIDEQQQAMRQLEAELGANELDRSFNKGKSMSLDEAVVFALEEDLGEM